MADGSQPLFDALELHRPALERFLQRRLRCADTANDVLQSMSERLVGQSVQPEIDNPKAYLFRAAANAAHSHTRAEKARSTYESAAADHLEDIDAADPERRLLGKEALDLVQAALDDLPILTRQMFIAFRVKGETQASIAKRFRVSRSTVEKRLAKATAHCHERLSDDEQLIGCSQTIDVKSKVGIRGVKT